MKPTTKQTFYKIVVIGLVIASANSLYSQNKQNKLVKKDSSDLVPFVEEMYYSENLNIAIERPQKILINHRFDPNLSSGKGGMRISNLGSPIIPTLYQNKFYKHINLGRNWGDDYFYNESNIPYFALNKPLSELDFIFFGNGNEEFKGFLSQNLSSKLNLGIGIRRANHKGFFLQQENEQNNLYTYLVHHTKRLRTNVEFVFNELNLKESGGYATDVYNSDLSPSQWVTATPLLVNAKNQFKNYEFNIRNRWLISHPKTDTLDSLLFVPIQSNFYIDHHFQKFSRRQYYSDELDSVSALQYGNLKKTGITALNSKYLHTGYSSDFRLSYNNKDLTVSAYNISSYNDIEVAPVFDTNIEFKDYLNLSIGGQIQYDLKENFQFSAHGYKGLLGYIQNDLLLSAMLSKHLQDWKFDGFTKYTHQLPGFINNYTYSSTIDSFYGLNTIKTLEMGIGVYNKRAKFKLNAQYFLIDDFLTYDSLQNPIQIQNNFFQIHLRKEWQYKRLFLPTEVFYQNSVFSRGIIRQMIAYKNKLFSNKNNVLFGLEVSLNFDYNSPRYSSFYMRPIYSESNRKANIYPNVTAFGTFKISKVHLSLVIDNFLSTYMQTGTSYLENLPITPSAFYLRANWKFLN